MTAVVALSISGCSDLAGEARSHIHAVGSSTVYPFAKQVSESFTRSNPDFKSPLIESTGTGNGIQLFCKGLGAQTPDMANASRRMKLSEFDACAANGVDEIVEVQVGLDGIAFASAQGGIQLALTPKIIYEALAAKPYGKKQTAKTWRDVDPSLPDKPILVYGPPSTSGTRDAFKELILAVGCDTNPEMAELKEADEEKHQQICTEVRSDGAYIDQGEQDNLIVQKIESNPQSVGLFGFSYLEENLNKVQGLTVSGVEPTYDNIANSQYPGARAMYVYVKKAHMRAIPGIKEYLNEWAASWAKGGRLARVGLVASPPEKMAENKRKIEQLTLLTRAELDGKAPQKKDAK
jgi:phosphate transport system substrate-binding protein